MKKVLQKSFAWLVMLVAMFAMSSNAMAQDVEFDYLDDCTSTHTQYLRNGVTTEFGSYWGQHGCDLYSGEPVIFKCSTANIVKVEFDVNYYQGTFQIVKGGGNCVMSNSNTLCTWTGSTSELEIKSSYDIAFSKARVWLEGGEEHNYVYSVVINNAPTEARLTYAGNDYANGSTIETNQLMTSSKITASEHTGFYLESLVISEVDSNDEGTITATYQAFAPISKSVYARMYNTSSSKIGDDVVVDYVQTSPTQYEISNFFGTGRSLFVDVANLTSMTMEGGLKQGDYYYLNTDWSASSFNGDTASSVWPSQCSYSGNVLTIMYYSTGIYNWCYLMIYFDEEYVTPSAVATFDMSAAEWATLCIDKAFAVPAGYTAYTVGDDVEGVATLVDSDDKIILTQITDVPAGTAVILNGPAESGVELFAPASTPSEPAVNFLVGTLTEREFTAVEVGSTMSPGAFDEEYEWIYGEFGTCQLYQLAKENDTLGFYRQVADGSSITCCANKAFLVVPAVVAAKNVRILLPNQEDTTDINAIAAENAGAIYNLYGQRVNSTKAGVYVKNGKKFIVK